MSRSVKRFLIPLILFVMLFFFLLLIPDEDSDLIGGISAFMMLIVLPLFLITLVWAGVGAIRDHGLKKEGVPTDDTLFPAVRNVKKAIAEDQAEAAELPQDLKRRRVNFRVWGTILLILGLGLLCAGLVILGTLLLIGGVALFISSTPSSYSGNVDGISLLACPPEYTLDRIYEDFKDYRTIHGSVIRGTTFPHCPALFWQSPGAECLFYLYKPQGKNLAYIGMGADVGCKKLTEPLFPAEPRQPTDFQGALCWDLEEHNFSEDLSEVIRHYLKTGEILPMPEYQKGNVFFFEEDFKLSGQRFTLLDSAKAPVYHVEGTYPLKTLRVYDESGSEIFRMTKELVRALPHYLFCENDRLIGEFSKNFDLARDSFSMQTAEGLLEMREINLLLGDNYVITLDGRRIGMIAERMNLTLENLVFDNMVLTVYDRKHLPLITALGVMAAREMARDEAADRS